MTIGDKIKTLRKENKLTLKELSFKTGISISFISDIENKRRNPSVDTLKILAKGLNVPASELLDSGNNSATNNTIEMNAIDEDAKVLVEKIQKLSKENKEKALKMLDLFLNENN
jgi:transcriptional regulator with XRE-family HTH domain